LDTNTPCGLMYCTRRNAYCSCLGSYFRLQFRSSLLKRGRKMTSGTGVSHFHANVAISHNNAKTNSEMQSIVEGNPLLFWRMPSMIATRPKIYPQKAVTERQKKVPQDSIALAEIVPAPPSTKLMEVTTNSAKNNTPPELPTSWPTKNPRITIVTRLSALIMDPVVLTVTPARPVSMDCNDMLRPCVGRKK
jgi:hypothetical protein